MVDTLERVEKYRRENEELRIQLREARETLRAIQSGEVDAVIVSRPSGEQVFTLEGADHPYRVMVENMGEGAVTLSEDGTILYCNTRLSQMLNQPLDCLIGTLFQDYAATAEQKEAIEALIRDAFLPDTQSRAAGKRQTEFNVMHRSALPVTVSLRKIACGDAKIACAIVTDLTEQKRNEHILGSEKLSRLIFELAAEMIVVCDEKGCITRANKRASLLCNGKPLLSHFDTAFTISLPGHDEPEGMFSVHRVFEGKVFDNTEAVLSLPDGRQANVLLSSELLFDDRSAINGCVITMVDVTRLKRTEEQLRQKESEFHSLFENVPLVIFHVDRQFRHLHVNGAGRKAAGIPLDLDLGNRSLREAGIPEEYASQWESYFRIVLETGQPVAGEFDFPTPEGIRLYSARVVPERGKDNVITSLLIVAHDITEQKRTEKALKQSERDNRTLLDTANSVIIRWTPDGTLRYINDYGLKLFGYTKEEVIGRSVQLMVPEKDSVSGADLTKLAEEVANSPEAHTYNENENIKKNRERTWTAWTNKAILDGQGNVREILSIGNDITSLKQAEEVLKRDKETLEKLVEARSMELVKAHSELERSRRMADLGRLSSTMAHEMRNPLSSVKAAAYNLKRKAKAPSLEKHFETIEKKVLEAEHIIQNLLNFSRVKKAYFEPVHILEVLDDCIATVSGKYPQWKVSVEKEVRFRADTVIAADAIQMKMLFTNILDNAYQALPSKSGSIKISLGINAAGNYEICVRDTGVGMSDKEQAKIFEPFFTTRSKGTGLGLTVCKEVVDLHRGSISVHSVKEKGTAFTVTLPPNQPVNQ